MKIKKISLILISLLIIFLTYYNAVYINPKQYKIRLESIRSNKLDMSFDDLTFIYFSDLYYDDNFDKDRLAEIIEKINSFNVDFILFGGDLIQDYNQKDVLIEEFKKLKAPLGKYACLGDLDLKEKAKSIEILNNADFKVLDNEMQIIYANNGKFIQLVGIDSAYMGNSDVLKAFENVDDDIFTIAITHCPDLFDSFSIRADLALSGHSLNGRIYLPLIADLFKIEGAKKYYHHKYKQYNSILDISSGLKKDIRLNADAEIVIYKLKRN